MGTNCSPRAPRVSRALSPEAELVSLCWHHAELVLTSLDVRAYKSHGGCGARASCGFCLSASWRTESVSDVCSTFDWNAAVCGTDDWFSACPPKCAKCIIPFLERLLKLTRHRWELRGPSKSRSKCVLALYQIVLGPYGILKCDEFVRP